ncbi:MAG: ABC transporter ATP-binding protein [Syntrophales bacterium]
MTLLQSDDVSFRYHGPWVLRHVSFNVEKGSFIGILGPNGSGKSTLLKILDGILTPQEGMATMDGRSILTMSRRDIARRVAVVPQDYAGIFTFTAREIVLMGRSPHLAPWAFEGKRDHETVNRVMAQTDTMSFADRSLEHLSGGERQRVLIARALAQEPRLMLLDEPTAFLDIRHQVEIMNLLKSLNKEEGLTVLAVTHDINLASLYCDRIILLDGGAIHAEGPPAEVMTTGNIEAVYGLPVVSGNHELTGRPVIMPRIEE